LDAEDKEKPFSAIAERYLWVNRERESNRAEVKVDEREALRLETEDEDGYYKNVSVYVRLSRGYACWIQYGNTPSFYDESLPVFEKFLQDFKALVR
jgi:hypothetical protein